jgi:hypothetical protein
VTTESQEAQASLVAAVERLNVVELSVVSSSEVTGLCA